MDASDTDSTATPLASTKPIGTPPSSVPNATPPPPERVAPTGRSAGTDIELTIAPLSLDALSLDPLPPIPESAATPTGAAPAQSAVLGDVHLELPPLELTDRAPKPRPASAPEPTAPTPTPAASPSAAPAPASPSTASQTLSGPVDDASVGIGPINSSPADSPVFEMLDLKIAPFDLPNTPLSREIAAVVANDVVSPAPAAAATAPSPAPPARIEVPTATTPQPDPVAHPAAAPPPEQHEASAPAPAPAPAPATPTTTPSAPTPPAPATATPSAPTPSAPAHGLPTDPVADDATPTTVIAKVIDGQIAPPAVPGHDAGAQPVTDVSVISVPNRQPSQVSQARTRSTVDSVAKADPAPAPTTVSRKDRKHDSKLKKHQQKQALQAAKAKSKSQRSGGGGVALFFTLLVLAGVIAGAIVYGKPYLFPDAWDDASRPYGEAVEVARGIEIAEPLVIQRRATDAFAVSMAAQVIGPWETDMPLWRSLGLVSGVVDASLLAQLVEDWTLSYYAPTTGEVIANDAAPAEALDAAITEAMAAAALDQETGWSSSIEETMLDASALTRSAVVASNRASADATAFGAADVSQRDIGVSTFLPPILEYRVNAPDAYAEFASENGPALDALAASSLLRISSEPLLAEGEVLVSGQQLTDRTFWYLVFASYTDAPTAYAASNALVEASLATADAAGTQCTYGTFSGTDVDGTARVADALQQWAANVPSAMNANFSTLPNGSMQLRSCDPGVDAASNARFGIGREIARLRTVELAAITALPTTPDVTVDHAAVINEIRTSAVGLTLLDLAFDATPSESAAQARTLVAESSSDAVAGE